MLVLRWLQSFTQPGAPTLLGPAMILAILEVTSFLCDVPVIPLSLLTLFYFCLLAYFFYSRRRNLSRSDDSAIRGMNWYNIANKYALDQLSDIIREVSVSGVWR